MANIKFKGRGHVDVHTLAAEDLQKAGVEGFRKTDFPLDQAVEVSDEVARAILEDPDLFGKFEAVEAKQDAKAATKQEEKAPTGKQ